MKPERHFPTKDEVAESLPIGTWFVWPGVISRRSRYYQPRVWKVLPDRRIGTAVYEEIVIWSALGVNSPKEAYARARAIATILNECQVDQGAARAFVTEVRQSGIDTMLARVRKRLHND